MTKLPLPIHKNAQKAHEFITEMWNKDPNPQKKFI